MSSLFSAYVSNSRFLDVESDGKAFALGSRCVVVVLVHRNFAMRTFEILNIKYSNCYYCKLLRCCAATVGFVFFVCGF